MFNFSVIKTVSKTISSYPINLKDVVCRSEYFRSIEDDGSLNSYITCLVIPKVINDWEKSTGYLLLDQTIQAFIPDLKSINTNQINIGFNHLNIREFTNFKYYPCDWNYTDAKSIFDASNYFIIPEAGGESAKLNFKEDYLPITGFSMLNNFEANYKAGFASNNFTTLNPAIKDVLACRAASVIDNMKGFCGGVFDEPNAQIYAEYSINKQMVVMI